MQDGIYSNETSQLLVDEANNLWVLHEHALSRIEFPSPYSFFRDENGLRGNTKDILRHEGNLYAATSHGLFMLKLPDKSSFPLSPNAVFNKFDGIETDCRCLESIPGALLAGSSAGLFEIRGQETKLVFSGPVNSLLFIRDQNILLAGTDAGLRILNAGDWTEIKNFSLPGVSIDNIALSPGNFLWLSSRSGILNRSTKTFSNPASIVFESFTSDQLESPAGSYTDLINTSTGLYFSTENGLYRYNPGIRSFYHDSLLSLPFNPGSYRVTDIAEDREPNFWLNIEHHTTGSGNIWYAGHTSDGSTKYQSLPYRRLNDLIINCLFTEHEEILNEHTEKLTANDKVLWMGTDQGVIRYDPRLEIPAGAGPRLHISKILAGAKNERIIRQSIPDSDKPGRINIPFSKNRIRFEFLSTDYNCESTPLFRYILSGKNEDWSEWTDVHFAEYGGLKRGRYEFRVQSQDIYGRVSESQIFTFRVKSPVFAAWYAIIVYFLLIMVLIWLIQKWSNIQTIKGQFHLEEIVQERTESLIKEKDKAEDLLANILPKTTADELKAGGKASSSKFKMCTVLFADIQGFTKIAEEMNPDKLIDQLDKFYYHFDSVVEKYNIEKIKTIGDAYMAAGGIPVKNRTNPVDVVLAALEMQKFMKELKKTQSDIWDLRIGVHTGSVIAGVVGQKKYSYDIWGDTVNTASRMESSGEIGKVNISATTYKLIKDFFQCEFRGKMPVKYKGDIAMFFVNGLNPIYSQADKITPNEKFNIQIQLLRLLDLEEVIIEKLEHELPEDLLFHNVEHTSHVYSQVELLGRGEKVNDEDLLLLQTAALLHDTGYIQGMDDHEERSVEFAREILPVYRYSEEQIDKICHLIKATSLPPKPESLLEQIICDANLDHLGRVDFLIQSDKLFQEYRMRNKIRSKKDWNQYQIDFLKNHEFYTEVANRMREVPKEQQIENIKRFS